MVPLQKYTHYQSSNNNPYILYIIYHYYRHFIYILYSEEYFLVNIIICEEQIFLHIKKQFPSTSLKIKQLAIVFSTHLFLFFSKIYLLSHY